MDLLSMFISNTGRKRLQEALVAPLGGSVTPSDSLALLLCLTLTVRQFMRLKDS